ncbi:MAG TPA: sigma-54 dependent transcriptional regulator [Myxococcaceae bacterium]|nr:sigma-54 dependent transcriptional regulator [Myxococcaceae bacterium]
MNDGGRILVVDDERRIAEEISEALTRVGHRCEMETSAEGVLARWDELAPEVVVTDWKMPGMDGLSLLRELRQRSPQVPVIVVTAYGDIPSAVATMREGAFHYLAKPFDNDELRHLVSRALELSRLHGENRRLKHQLESGAGRAIVTRNPAMLDSLRLLERAGRGKAAVLIEGESGTGKELAARHVHLSSPRAQRPFVAVNCKAFAETLLESELFGHERGAFTGAAAARAGCFERANGGTLFLDEIGEVSPAFQAKLLRVLQEGEVQRVGADSPRKVDVRIVCATNKALAAEVSEGRFREDLFFRLNVIHVRLPPLRERAEDILLLAERFLERAGAETGRSLRLSMEVRQALLAHPWPGNVRELENAMERAILLCEDEEIREEHVLLHRPSEAPKRNATPRTLQQVLDEVTAQEIRAALQAHRDRRQDAAAALGIDRTTLYRLMKRFGMTSGTSE